MIGTSNQQTENGMNVATRGQERQYGDADQIEAKVNEWLSKIDVNEVLTYIEIDEDADHAFAKASSTNNAEAIGLVFMAVKRNYAERLALRDLELELVGDKGLDRLGLLAHQRHAGRAAQGDLIASHGSAPHLGKAGRCRHAQARAGHGGD